MARILVIEDDADCLRVVGCALRQNRHEVYDAHTAQEAILVIERERLDLVICDLRLGATDALGGLDVLKEIKVNYQIPVIMVGAHGTIGVAVQAMQHGARTFLEKPLSLSQLMTAVVDHVRHDRSEDQCGRCVASTYGRWAEAIVAIVSAQYDPTTMEKWARLAGASRSTLDARCRVVGLSGGRAHRFGRLLRASWLLERQGIQPKYSLDVADPRTRSKLFVTAGGDDESSFPTSVAHFLLRQRLVIDPQAISAVRRLLDES